MDYIGGVFSDGIFEFAIFDDDEKVKMTYFCVYKLSIV